MELDFVLIIQLVKNQIVMFAALMEQLVYNVLLVITEFSMTDHALSVTCQEK